MPQHSARDRPGRKSVLAAGESACDAAQVLFGENFRLVRITAGLTQHDIEAQTGIKQAYISQIESGKQNPSLATMTTLALVVGKEVRALLKPVSSLEPK